jgi:hypothetical protein
MPSRNEILARCWDRMSLERQLSYTGSRRLSARCAEGNAVGQFGLQIGWQAALFVPPH